MWGGYLVSRLLGYSDTCSLDYFILLYLDLDVEGSSRVGL